MRFLAHSETLVFFDVPHLITAYDQFGVAYICLLVEENQNTDTFLCVPVTTGRLNKLILLIILLAITSTIFDFIFFGIFHKVGASLLQTLWFIESILTEIFLIFSIRTMHFFLKAKVPSFPLIVISFFTILTTILLPFTNFGKNTFQFVSPPIPSLLIVLTLVISYFLVSEMVKLLYFRYWKIKA